MLNFSRIPNRLDTFPLQQKIILIFCLSWMIIYVFFQLIPTIGAPQVNQASAVLSFELTVDSSSQERKDGLISGDECLTAFCERTMETSHIFENFFAAKETLDRKLLPIPMELYLHPENHLSSKFHWVPVVLEEKISEDDILVDLSSVIDPELSYELSAYYKYIVGLIVERESGNQSFLGQLLVAEDVVSRIRSGLYGSDIDSVLIGYLAKKERDGKLHVYLGAEEFLEVSPSTQKAVELALSGSQVSYFLLQAVTELRNEQYDLQLDHTYYQWGALFHFAPKRIDATAIKNRSFTRVPVSFQYKEHIFYGRWD